MDFTFKLGSRLLLTEDKEMYFLGEPKVFQCGANADNQRIITLNMTGFADYSCLQITSLGKTIII